MMLTTLVMMLHEVKAILMVSLLSILGLCEVMGLHIHIALVNLDCGCE